MKNDWPALLVKSSNTEWYHIAHWGKRHNGRESGGHRHEGEIRKVAARGGERGVTRRGWGGAGCGKR